MNYFTSSFKLTEWLHSYHCIWYPIITAANTQVFHSFDFVAPQTLYILSIASHLPHLFHSVTLWYFIDFSCVLGTSKMELFPKKVNRFQPLTVFRKSSIFDVQLDSGCTCETVSFCSLTPNFWIFNLYIF